MSKAKKPPPLELFAFYHLGLDRQGTYKFRNLTHTACYFQVDEDQILHWLQEDHIDSETIRQVDFNLSAAHADIMEASWSKRPEEVLALARELFASYCEALKTSTGNQQFFDLDYDDIWK